MATKRKQRRPDEDLAAAVAEILDNPIVKINLGFLNVGKPGNEDLSLNGMRDPSPLGDSPAPIGQGLRPVGDGPSNCNRVTDRSAIAHGVSLVADTKAVEAIGSDERLKPMGFELAPPALTLMGAGRAEAPFPMGDELTPMGREVLSQLLETPAAQALSGSPVRSQEWLSGAGPQISSPSVDREASAAGFGITPTGYESTPMGVGQYPMGSGTSQSMFLAEQLCTLFPAARVHRIRLAQDALSHVEEKVYDLLWGVKNQSRDAYRLSEFSLQRIANEGRLNIKTVRELLPRLVEKGFIAIEREPDVRRNRPTQYRVWSYGEVLADQRGKNRLWFVKTGKGVFYARPVSVGVTEEDTQTERLKPMGVGPAPVGVDDKPGGVDREPIGLVIKPMGVEVRPVGAAVSQGFLSELSGCIRSGLGMTPDEALLKSLVEDCRQKSRLTDGEPASEEEILQFTAMKIRVLRHASKLRNPLAVLRRAVPECFIGQPLMEHRAAERARKGRELEELRQYEASLYEQEEESKSENERLGIWERISGRHRTAEGYDLRAIAEDPELDEYGRTVALERMRRLGRFAPRGL